MKKVIWGLIIVVLLVAVPLGYWGWRLREDYLVQSPAPQTVKIPHGASMDEIATELHRNDVISNPLLFRWVAVQEEADTKLKAGRYHFEAGLTMIQVIQKLVAGEVIYKVLTVPEGLPRTRLVELLPAVDLRPAIFLKLTADPVFIQALGIPAQTLEGYLFPNTYYLDDEETEEGLIRLMVAEFKKNFPDEFIRRAKELSFSAHEALTLASIIEGEAQADSERAVISAVYHNRLKLGWHLEADPTVQYAHGTWKARLLYKDLEIDSPYNTYRYPGLPPGPINSPGAASIRAALYPAEADYLYFVAKGDGSHIFSKTNEQHNEARLAVRRMQDQ